MNTGKKGFFIAIEGPDGSGKTTVREWVAQWFKDIGHDVTLTREPGGTPYAEQIRELLLSDRNETVPAISETMLFMAARGCHIETVIKPNVEAGRVVISDRFCDSTFAYQGAGRGLSVDRLRAMHEEAFDSFYPDLTIVLDGDPLVLASRITNRGKLDHFESMPLDFHNRTRELYRSFVQQYPDRYAMVDAMQPQEQVRAQLVPVLLAVDQVIRVRPSHI